MLKLGRSCLVIVYKWVYRIAGVYQIVLRKFPANSLIVYQIVPIYSLQIISGTYSIENWVLTSKYLSLTSSQKWMNGHRATTSETIEVAGNPMFFFSNVWEAFSMWTCFFAPPKWLNFPWIHKNLGFSWFFPSMEIFMIHLPRFFPSMAWTFFGWEHWHLNQSAMARREASKLAQRFPTVEPGEPGAVRMIPMKQ